jgi:hypothetical protein
MCNLPKLNSVWSIVNRLVLGACVYFVWQERNRRFHENIKRPPEEIIKLVTYNVKLRLLGLPMTKSVNTVTVARIWDLKGIKWRKPKKPTAQPISPSNPNDV